MLAALDDPAIRRLVVTGHPNHELAIFGFVQRMRPSLLFLTDGGGQQRVDESRRALASIGALERAKFLGWREPTLYDALLAIDTNLFLQLVDEVRQEIIAVEPRQVLCESVELYNPLHDITLPIVRAAAAGISDVEIIEFPLIAQEPSPDERYRVQRFPADRASIAIQLNAAELEKKLYARDHEYGSLRGSTAVVDSVSRENAGTEVFAPAADTFPTPGRDHVLRYEARGGLLQARGEVERVITFADHFLPAVSAIERGVNAAPAAPGSA